jgi:hypothetical protein
MKHLRSLLLASSMSLANVTCVTLDLATHGTE